MKIKTMREISKLKLNLKKFKQISICYSQKDTHDLEDSLPTIANKIAEITLEHVQNSIFPDTIERHGKMKAKITDFTKRNHLSLYIWKERGNPYRRAIILYHRSTGLCYVHDCVLSTNARHGHAQRESLLLGLIENANSNSTHPLSLFLGKIKEKELQLHQIEKKSRRLLTQNPYPIQTQKIAEQGQLKKLSPREQTTNHLIQYLLQSEPKILPEEENSKPEIADGIAFLKAVLHGQKGKLSTIKITTNRKKSTATLTLSYNDGKATSNIDTTLSEVDLSKMKEEDSLNKRLHTLVNAYYELEPNEYSWLLARSTEITTNIYPELIEQAPSTQELYIETMIRNDEYSRISEILQSCLDDLSHSANANQNNPLILISTIVKLLPKPYPFIKYSLEEYFEESNPNGISGLLRLLEINDTVPYFMREISTKKHLIKQLSANNILKLIQAIAAHEYRKPEDWGLFFSALNEKMTDSKAETSAHLQQQFQKDFAVPEIKAIALIILQSHEAENQEFEKSFESIIEKYNLPRDIYRRGQALFLRKKLSQVSAPTKAKALTSPHPHKRPPIKKTSLIHLIKSLLQSKIETTKPPEKKGTHKKAKKVKSSKLSVRKLIQEARKDALCKTNLTLLVTKPESTNHTNPFSEYLDENPSEHLSGYLKNKMQRVEESLSKLTATLETALIEKNSISIFDKKIADEYRKNKHIIDELSEENKRSLAIFYDSLEQLYPLKKMKSCGIEIDTPSLFEDYCIHDVTPILSGIRTNYYDSSIICKVIEMLPADRLMLESLELTERDKVLLKNIRAYGQVNPKLHRALYLRGLISANFTPKWQQIGEDITLLINIKLHHQAHLPETSIETQRQIQILIEKNIKQYSENIMAMHERNPIDGTRYHMISTAVTQDEAQKLKTLFLKTCRHSKLSKETVEIVLQAINISIRELHNQLTKKPISLDRRTEFAEKEAENIIAQAIEESEKFATSISPQEHQKALSASIQDIAENNYPLKGKFADREKEQTLEIKSIEKQISSNRKEQLEVLGMLKETKITKEESLQRIKLIREQHKSLYIKRHKKTLLFGISNALVHTLIPELKPLIICTIAKKYFAQEKIPLTKEQKIQITIDMLVKNKFATSDLSEAGLLKDAQLLSLGNSNQKKASPIADPKKQPTEDKQGEFMGEQEELNTKPASLERLHMFAESKEKPTQLARKATREFLL